MTVLQEDLDFLAHYGKKGMRWGVRNETRTVKNTARAQKRIDRVARVASGTASKSDRVTAYLATGTTTKRSAQYQLRQAADMQDKIAVGRGKTNNMLLKLQGVKASELNMHRDVAGISMHERRIQQIERVAQGKGSKLDKAKVWGMEAGSAMAIARNGGSLQKSAAVKAANMRARDARLKAGERRVSDVIQRAGGDRLAFAGKLDKDAKLKP